MGYVLFVTSPTSIDLIVFERLLQTTVSASSIEQLCRKHKVKVRQGIYGLAIVIWLMIYQRLNGKRTLSSAVQFLARQAVHWQRWPSVGRRIREGRISIVSSPAPPQNYESFGVADLNGDGKLDIWTTDDGVTIYSILGNGNGTFQAP